VDLTKLHWGKVLWWVVQANTLIMLMPTVPACSPSCTVRVLRQEIAFKDAIGSHACSFEASMRVTDGIPLRAHFHTRLTILSIPSKH
jgi:hypothetical protein